MAGVWTRLCTFPRRLRPLGAAWIPLGAVWSRLEPFGARLRLLAGACGPSARPVASVGREILWFSFLFGLPLAPGAAAAAKTTWAASRAFLCRCLDPFVHFSASFAVACAHANPFRAVCGVVSQTDLGAGPDYNALWQPGPRGFPHRGGGRRPHPSGVPPRHAPSLGKCT